MIVGVLGCVTAGCDEEVTAPMYATLPYAASCLPVAHYGAIPDDGRDDRAALQAALDDGCLDLRNAPGRYDVMTPPMPRSIWVLRAPDNAQIVGSGDDSVIAFSGDAGRDDWWGIRLASRAHVHHVRFDGDGLRNTTEHAPLLFWVGPVDGVTIERTSFRYPVRAGEKRGDCIQGVGYAPDKLSTNITIEHNEFLSCGRSSYAWHSGLRNLKYRYNNHIDISDQLDGEGRGNEPHALIADSEIAYNKFQTGKSAEGNLAIQIVRGVRLEIHHNELNGRGIDLADVSDSELHHNEVTLTMAEGDWPAIMIRKGSTSLKIHDETYTRVADGGPVLSIENRGTGPRDISIVDTTITQLATWHAVRLAGASEVTFSDVDLNYGGGPGMSAFSFEGVNTPATGLRVLDSRIKGPVKAAVYLSGAYAGAGTLQLERTTTAGASMGLWCRYANIKGPITYGDNAMPAPACDSVPMLR